MTPNGWLQFAIYSVILLALVRPVGIYLARVVEGERTWLDPVLRPCERLIYKLCAVNAEKEMNWRQYAFALLGFSAVTMVFTYAIERLQQYLPFNPQHFPAVGPDLAFNTAASFTTNTNWQFYSGESTMSYLTQMMGLATHNFWSAAAGIVVAVALIRGIKRTTSATIGNFWVDMTRTLLYVLMPACVIYALLLVWQGVPQNFSAYTAAHTVEQPSQVQTIAQGPVASQEAIKMLGTNGGGFFNANSADPYENPTPLSNYMEILSIFVIGAGLTYTLGRMTGSTGHGWAVCAAMYVLFAAGFLVCYWAEAHPNPLIHGAQQVRTVRLARRQHGRQGGPQRHRGKHALRHHHHRRQLRRRQQHARQLHSARRHGSPGQHHGGRSHLRRRRRRHVRHVDLRCALGVHRRPHGRPHAGVPGQENRSLRREDGHALRAYLRVYHPHLLRPSSCFGPKGRAPWLNPGPHGFSEVLYSFVSGAGNNGSAFAGLGTNWWYNIAMAFDMLIGRFLMMIPVLALAGNLAQKKSVPPSPGTFPVNTPLFTVLLIGVVLIVGALTFFPALSLGPILEHLLLHTGHVF